MRNRAAAIIIHNEEVALIKREWKGEIYYVFPGGGIQDGESIEQATIREAFEELGVHIKINRHFDQIIDKGIQYYLLAEIIGGRFGSGKGEEYTFDRNRGSYRPMWIHLRDLCLLDIRPKQIANKILNIIE